MHISTIIPTYNRRETLARALESVLAQSDPVDEIIVVDDGSTDDTAAWLRREYPMVMVIEQKNRGVSAARNAGIRVAKCEWIALLDSDDEWLPGKIAAIRAFHRKRPDLPLIHSDEIWIRHGTRVNAMNKHRKHGGKIFRHCLPLCVISPSAAVIRRDLLKTLGGFDENLPACEDYDLWLKICHRHEVGYIETPQINKYGGHEDQLSQKHYAMDRFRINALDRLLQTTDLTEDDAIATAAMIRKKLRILLNGAAKHGNRELIVQYEPMRRRYLNGAVAC